MAIVTDRGGHIGWVGHKGRVGWLYETVLGFVEHTVCNVK